jgi:hypothetical protein
MGTKDGIINDSEEQSALVHEADIAAICEPTV